jgi:hypothetical protein
VGTRSGELGVIAASATTGEGGSNWDSSPPAAGTSAAGVVSGRIGTENTNNRKRVGVLWRCNAVELFLLERIPASRSESIGEYLLLKVDIVK